VTALQSSEKMPVKKARIVWGSEEDFLDLLFFLAVFLAPNFILGPGLLALFRGGPLLGFVVVAERVDFLAVFRGDLRVVFFAGMVRLLHSFWEI
jgi:hypothetical protein